MAFMQRKSNLMLVVLLAGFLVTPLKAFAGAVLNFSDITSGPKVGNTDGVGSGAIVTIWGNNLGSTQGTSKVYVGGVQATAIYYWKDADGALPGGPSDLKTYHKMQEIAFAIPSGAADGANTIKVNVGGADSNTLPFTVRAGNIKFIKSTGSDSTGTGSWTAPYATLNSVFAGGNGKIAAGDIVYSVGVGSTSGIKVGGTAQVAGTASSPISLVAYPNTVIALSGLGGDSSVVDNWYPSNRQNAYVNFSKLSITASGNDGDPSNGISVIPYNRVIGTAITGPTVYGGYGGAITGTAGVPQGGAYLGIYIHNYGYPTHYSYNWDSSTWTSPPYNGIGAACTNCTSVDRFQHLLYISNRTTTRADAYEIGWGYFTDNPVLHGIHIYDMGDAAGWNGTIKIHHNVVKNQRGSAIDVSFPATTAMEIHDNMVIVDATEPYNHGPAFDLQGAATAKVYNNTVYGYTWYNRLESAIVDFRNNIMVDTRGVNFTGSTPTSYSNNLFYSTMLAALPSWYSTANGDKNANPLFTNASGYDFSLTSSSPAQNAGTGTVLTVAPADFLNQPRQSGAVSLGTFGLGLSASLTLQPPTNLMGTVF